jgi:hypothetical protein
MNSNRDTIMSIMPGITTAIINKKKVTRFAQGIVTRMGRDSKGSSGL